MPALSNCQLPSQQSTRGDSHPKAAKITQHQKANKEVPLERTSQMLLTILEKLTKQEEIINKS